MKFLIALTLGQVIFNRKRHKENGNVLLRQFTHHMLRFEEGMLSEYYNKLSEADKIRVAKFGRIQLMGKKGIKITYMLFDEIAIEDTKLLIKFRNEAGVHPDNGFLFAIPGSNPSMDWFKTHYLLQTYAEEAGCEHPSLITATQLCR